MFVSKHHYAVELAKRGNRVLFLEPPREHGPLLPKIRLASGYSGIEIVSRRTLLPSALRFKLRSVYDRLVAVELLHLRRTLRRTLDVVWCFEPSLYPDLRQFGAPLRIFHPVDMVSGEAAVRVASTAQLVLSVADNILEHFRGLPIESHFVPHGLGPDFAAAAQTVGAPWHPHDGPVKVGYVGNLFIRQLDRQSFRTIIREHPSIEFHIWGPRSPEESNLGASSLSESAELVRFLRTAANVRLHGVLPPAELAPRIHAMDAFLLSYDPVRDPAGGANSHKIVEYMSTGRVIVANHVSTYAARHPQLMQMPATTSNATLPEVFRTTMSALSHYNRPELHSARLEHALSHSYAHHVDRIEELLDRVAGMGGADNLRLSEVA